MDDHQRAMWRAMLDRVSEYRAGSITLPRLVHDLRGLYVEADPHDPRTREEFESTWAPIDAESELRTEPWAPPGAASDERLERVLNEFALWVGIVLNADQSMEHG